MQYDETWTLTFTTAAGLAALTKTIGSIQRFAGGVSVNTASVPFSLAPNQSAVISDIYVSGAPAQDGYIDFDVNELPLKLGVVASTVNSLQAGRKHVRPFSIAQGYAFRPVFYNIAVSLAVTVTAFVSATIVQK